MNDGNALQTLIDAFVEKFDVWEETRPYVTMMFDEAEMELILAMDSRSISADEAAGMLDVTVERASEVLRRAYEHCIFDLEEGEEDAESGQEESPS